MSLQRDYIFIIISFLCLSVWLLWQFSDSHKCKTQPLLDEFINLNTKKKFLTVNTDVLSLRINIYGGDIEQAYLLTYSNKIGSRVPFQILTTTSEFINQIQSKLVSSNIADNLEINYYPLYKVKQNEFNLKPGANSISVPIYYKTNNGIVYRKLFILERGKFFVKIIYQINNLTKSSLKISLFGQLKKNKLSKHNINSFLKGFKGIAYSNDKIRYKKVDFSSIEKPIKFTTKNGWIAMLQRYFAVAWIPKTQENHFYISSLENGTVITGFKSTPIIIDPGKQKNISVILWIGPKIQDSMVNVARYLNYTVDYGWLWFIAQPLFRLLKIIYNIVGNWGWAIVTITFIVRGVLYPITKAQYISIAKIRMLQPKIQTIRKNTSHDKQKLNQEIVRLYKSENINPFGGCFPVFIQMPIFLALYYMLTESVELRHASWVLWIKDLSDKDPFYVLPILMGLSMFLIQKISPNTTNDYMQNKILTIVPTVFTIFSLWFPSGLVLYYTVNNFITIFQQKLFYHLLKKKGLFVT